MFVWPSFLYVILTWMSSSSQNVQFSTYSATLGQMSIVQIHRIFLFIIAHNYSNIIYHILPSYKIKSFTNFRPRKTTTHTYSVIIVLLENKLKRF